MTTIYTIPQRISPNKMGKQLTVQLTAPGVWEIYYNNSPNNEIYTILHVLKYLLTQIQIYISSDEKLLRNSYFQDLLNKTGIYYVEFMGAIASENGTVIVNGTPIKYAPDGGIIQEDIFEYINKYEHTFPYPYADAYVAKNMEVKKSAEKRNPYNPGTEVSDRMIRGHTSVELSGAIQRLVVPAVAALELFRKNVTQIHREDDIDKLKTTVTGTLSKVQTSLNATPANISAFDIVTDKSIRLSELLNTTIHTIAGFSYNEIKTEPYYNDLQFNKNDLLSTIKKAKDKSFTAPSGNSGNTHPPIQSNEDNIYAFFDDSGMASTSGSSQINLDNISQALNAVLHVNPTSQDNVEISNPDIYRDSSGEMVMGYLAPTDKQKLAADKKKETEEFIKRIKQDASETYTAPSARTVFYSMVKADSFRT